MFFLYICTASALSKMRLEGGLDIVFFKGIFRSLSVYQKIILLSLEHAVIAGILAGFMHYCCFNSSDKSRKAGAIGIVAACVYLLSRLCVFMQERSSNRLYAGNYTPYPTYDDYSGGRSITLNADGVVSGGKTDGQTPTSIVQNSDGSITIWFGSSDRYTLFPVGCSGTPAGTGYDSTRVNLEYLYTGGGVMNIIYYADPAS